MPVTDRDGGRNRSDEEFATRCSYITQLRGFRRTGSSSKAEPRAFRDFNLWKKPNILSEIIVGCSRLEAQEEDDDFPARLRILCCEIEYINPRVRFGRFEILQVYNYLVDSAHRIGNPINKWKGICVEFINKMADTTSDRHLSPSSYRYENYVTIFKRLLDAYVELKFGRGTSMQYSECVRQSIREKGQGLEPHRDHPGFCVREKQTADASQEAPAARPIPGDESEPRHAQSNRGGDESEPRQSQSNRGSNGIRSQHARAEHDPRQDIRPRTHTGPMEERVGYDRGPVGDIDEHANRYAYHEPASNPQYPRHDRPEYNPGKYVPYRPYAAPMEERVGYDRIPVGGMGGRAQDHAHREPSLESQYSRHDRAAYDPRQDTRPRPHAAPMEERIEFDRVPVRDMGSRIHRFPEHRPSFEAQHYSRGTTDNRASRPRRATFGEADRMESDMRGIRNRMAGL